MKVLEIIVGMNILPFVNGGVCSRGSNRIVVFKRRRRRTAVKKIIHGRK